MPSSARPPDLDEAGQPVTATSRPPDLDASGAPVGMPSTHQAAQMASTPGSAGSLALRASTAALPVARRVVEEVATNPNAVAIGRTTGKALGGAAGLVEAGPLGGIVGMSAGGKTGARVAPAVQKLAAPVASIIERATPYVQALTTLSGAQGVLDLAQMAEPTRKDIGTLGIGKTVHVAGEHPALLNLAAQKIRDAIKGLMAHGVTRAEAAQLLVKRGT